MANDPNPADFLDRPEQIANYLSSYLRPEASLLFIHRLSLFIRKAGARQVAEQSNMRVETVYNMMQPQTKPHLSTVIKLLDALGYRLTITPKE